MHVRQIPVAQLIKSSFGSANKHPNSCIELLAEDIKVNGIKRLLIVRPAGDMYEVLAGMARWKGAILAGQDTVPAEVCFVSDDEAERIAMEDNMSPPQEIFGSEERALADLMTDADMNEVIEASRALLAKTAIIDTPTFALNEPLQVELCELFRADFERDAMIQSALDLYPKADRLWCEECFDRFFAGLDDGRLHLEGHRFAVNESLLIHLESYLDPEAMPAVFGPNRWNCMKEDRKDLAVSFASTMHPKIKKILQD